MNSNTAAKIVFILSTPLTFAFLSFGLLIKLPVCVFFAMKDEWEKLNERN